MKGQYQTRIIVVVHMVHMFIRIMVKKEILAWSQASSSYDYCLESFLEIRGPCGPLAFSRELDPE